MKKAGDESIFQQYVRYAEVLRNWFIGYGIGGVVLFVSGQSAFASVPKNELVPIGIWFIVGVVFQVILAFTNKVYNFILYYNSTKPRPDAVITAVEKRNLLSFLFIDVPLDGATMASFAWATFLLFKFLLSMTT